MTWLDKLKGLFKFNVDLSNFTLIRLNITTKTNSDNSYHLDLPNNTIHLNPTKLNHQEKQRFKEIIQQAIYDDDYTLIENKASEVVEDFKAKGSNADSQKVLDSLKTAISPEDLKIIRAALYMRTKFREGDIKGGEKAKVGIISIYGVRGKNICNLCSANYFEDWIIPLYEASKKSETAKSQFKPIYDIIINESAFGVFINRNMNEEQVTLAIEEKIRRNSSYGITYANIHGIGKTNIKNIKSSLKNLEDRYEFTVEIDQKIGDIMFARLEYSLPSSC